MLDPERLTIKAQQAIGQAQSLAQTLNHQEIDVEHLLLALVGQRDGVIMPLLQRLGVNITSLEEKLREELDARPKVQGAGKQYGSPRLDKVLDASRELAQGFKDEYVSTEHMLLAIV